MQAGINWDAIAEYFVYDPQRPLIFSSAQFFVVFLFFYAIYISLKNRTILRTLYTLAFSIFFYYKSSGIYLLLLVLSTGIDFTLGHYIYNASTQARRRFFLWLSIAANLGLLGYFKYTNFFLNSVNAITGSGFDLMDIFLPAGISFYTFQTMSYSIDVYRRHLEPLTEKVKDWRSFLVQFMDFGFFVSFFPQLVAGPIVRAADFLPQINRKLGLSHAEMGRALLLICGGLFKKAVISDYISVNFVDRVFENPGLYSGLENLMAVYGYAFQIYCDFSGYSDMAIGLALLMGFHLNENFHTPYKSTSIQEFWRRWHISLSTWLRDYLYISLGGNRKGKLRTYVNLMITMLLGGLWHGTSWVFIVWGGLHGLALAIDRFLGGLGRWFRLESLRSLIILLVIHLIGAGVLWGLYNGAQIDGYEFGLYMRANALVAVMWIALFALALLVDQLAALLRGKTLQGGLSKAVSSIFVFHFVCLCWVFFRAGAFNNPVPPMVTTSAVLTQIGSAFHPELFWQIIQGYKAVIGLIILAFLTHFMPLRLDRFIERVFIGAPALGKAFALAFIIWIVIQTASSDVVPFIYFQF
ncbi:MAG: MBOAT family protein [Saprospiraceae bacterium]|nr:MBOAT family protein [Saprospiraceae bacterium]